jgi:predicted GIY-YIG superfamily endonuclease
MKLPKYQNLDTEKNKILSANREKSGVYMWINKINGKRYIGSSDNLSRRFDLSGNTLMLII